MEEDSIIYIIEKPKYQNFGNTTVLDEISVSSSNYKNGSADSGYLTENITGVGLWGKRSLQDTPYSISIISKDLIENVQANDMSPIFKINPITQHNGDVANGIHRPIIRGFGVENAVVNGMPIANFYSFTTMEDLERVETISGATGFLYGGGRVGGAVNYVMKKPTLENQRSIRIGNYGGEQYYGHIDLSGQIDDKNIFGYRINSLYQDGDSVADVGKEQKFVSLAFDYKPTDNFTMDLNYAHRDLKQKNIKPSISVSANNVRPILDVSKGYSADWTSGYEKNDRVMTSLKWDINDIFTLRSSLLYEKADLGNARQQVIFTRNDGLYDGLNIKDTAGKNQEFESYAGNIYLDSKFETFGLNNLLTFGYSESYYKYLNMQTDAVLEFFSGVELNKIKNMSIPSGNISEFGFIPMQKTQYRNILIGDDIVFNDQWSALIGANYATLINTNYSSGVKQPTYDESKLTPTLSLMYKPFEDLTTYITYIESFERGSLVGTDYQNEGETLAPYKSTQYEVGAKYNLNESVLLTGSLFRIEKANNYADNTTTPKPTLTQDGEAIHQGLELTVSGKITDNLTLFGGGTWMDLSVEKATNKDIEGKKPTNAATKMAKLYAEYDIPFVSGLTVTGGAYYTGERYGDELNTDKIPSYTLYDAGLRYKTKLDKYPTTFLLNVSNLTGEDYWASSSSLGDPRTVAFSMKLEF
ncbi:TonB-dependent siderophore receptor [Arcobacter sp. FW59]|nr:TonB-dependent siderophore receptor [Arcobacter sp. FW59]